MSTMTMSPATLRKLFKPVKAFMHAKHFETGESGRRYLQTIVRPVASIPLPFANKKGISIEQSMEGDIPGEWIVPQNFGPKKIVYFHGGAFIMMKPKFYRSLTIPLARITGCRVFVPSYRLAPENPFPAGLNDCVEAYIHLLRTGHNAHDIVFAGDSAGGNLVLATMLKLLKEKNGIYPLPRAGICLSPFLDVWGNKCGESRIANKDKDWFLPAFNIPAIAELYCGVKPGVPDSVIEPLKTNYLVSPVHAPDDLLQKLPPIHFEASKTELLLRDTTYMVERLGGLKSSMYLVEDEAHVFQIAGDRYTPAVESFKRMRYFLTSVQRKQLH